LVRFLVRDDARQASAVRALLAAAERDGEAVMVPLLVVLELVWVLSSAYGCDRPTVLQSIETLLALPVLRFEDHSIVVELCRRGRESSTDLDDLLIGLRARSLGCDAVLTFDKAASRCDLFEAL
jgi:predicted nucleic-acid-binding protein